MSCGWIDGFDWATCDVQLYVALGMVPTKTRIAIHQRWLESFLSLTYRSRILLKLSTSE